MKWVTVFINSLKIPKRIIKRPQLLSPDFYLNITLPDVRDNYVWVMKTNVPKFVFSTSCVTLNNEKYKRRSKIVLTLYRSRTLILQESLRSILKIDPNHLNHDLGWGNLATYIKTYINSNIILQNLKTELKNV